MVFISSILFLILLFKYELCVVVFDRGGAMRGKVNQSLDEEDYEEDEFGSRKEGPSSSNLTTTTANNNSNNTNKGI